MQRKPSSVTTKLKEEWNTKEDTGKSMENALCILRYAKRHLLGCSNIEQQIIKPAIVDLHLSGGISQFFSQLISQ